MSLFSPQNSNGNVCTPENSRGAKRLFSSIQPSTIEIELKPDHSELSRRALSIYTIKIENSLTASPQNSHGLPPRFVQPRKNSLYQNQAGHPFEMKLIKFQYSIISPTQCLFRFAYLYTQQVNLKRKIISENENFCNINSNYWLVLVY